MSKYRHSSYNAYYLLNIEKIMNYWGMKHTVIVTTVISVNLLLSIEEYEEFYVRHISEIM